MTEMLDVLHAFSTPLKAAWIVWLVWGAGQIVWYRRQHVEVVRALPAPRPRPKRPPKPVDPQAPQAPTVPAEPDVVETAG